MAAAKPFLSLMSFILYAFSCSVQAQDTDAITWVKAKALEADIVTIAADPGMADVPEMLQSLIAELGASGFGAYAVSSGPWMAANIEDIAKRDGDELERYLSNPQNARQMQVLNTHEALSLIGEIKTHWAHWPRNIWGIDQEFLTSAPFLLERLSLFAKDEATKAAILSYRAQALAEDYYLASASDEVFDHLRTLFDEGDEEPLALINEMALSKHIYGPFLDGSPQMKKAHERREALLFENFLRYIREDKAPKVIIELPPAHLHKETTPLDVPSFGNSLKKYAKAKGQKIFSLAVLCGPNGQRRLIEGAVKSCGQEFSAKYAELLPLASHNQNADLLFPSALQVQGMAASRLKNGFDAILIINNARPTTKLAGPAAKMQPVE